MAASFGDDALQLQSAPKLAAGGWMSGLANEG